MATSIQWTDTTGSATLNNGMPAPGDRFAGWTPSPNPSEDAADRVWSLAGATHEWKFRTDYTATFRLEYIQRDDLDLVDRLILHLQSGGSITVNTGDVSVSPYPSRIVRPQP